MNTGLIHVAPKHRVAIHLNHPLVEIQPVHAYKNLAWRGQVTMGTKLSNCKPGYHSLWEVNKRLKVQRQMYKYCKAKKEQKAAFLKQKGFYREMWPLPVILLQLLTFISVPLLPTHLNTEQCSCCGPLPQSHQEGGEMLIKVSSHGTMTVTFTVNAGVTPINFTV